MSIKNIAFNQNARSLILENFEAHNSFVIKENVNSIIHSVNEQTGEYTIKNSNGDRLLAVSMDGTLTNQSAIKDHINNAVAPLTSQVANHQENLDSLSIPTNFSGTTTNDTEITIATVSITNNTMGMIDGCIYSSGCVIKFNVHIQNVSSTISILSYNKDYFNSQNSESVDFAVSGSNLLIKFTNDTGPNNYSGNYYTNFISI